MQGRQWHLSERREQREKDRLTISVPLRFSCKGNWPLLKQFSFTSFFSWFEGLVCQPQASLYCMSSSYLSCYLSSIAGLYVDPEARPKHTAACSEDQLNLIDSPWLNSRVHQSLTCTAHHISVKRSSITLDQGVHQERSSVSNNSGCSALYCNEWKLKTCWQSLGREY